MGRVRISRMTRVARVDHMAQLVAHGVPLFTEEGLNMSDTLESVVGPPIRRDKCEGVRTPHPLEGCFVLGAGDGIDWEIGEDGVTAKARLRSDGRERTGVWVG